MDGCTHSSGTEPEMPAHPNSHLYETQKLGLQQVFGFSFAEFALGVSSVVIHQRSSSNSFFKV